MLQRVAVCCNVLYYVAVCCSMLQYDSVYCSLSSHTHERAHTNPDSVRETRWTWSSYQSRTLQIHGSSLCNSRDCNTLQHTATYCNTQQHNTAHCNTVHHTTLHCNRAHTNPGSVRQTRWSRSSYQSRTLQIRGSCPHRGTSHTRSTPCSCAAPRHPYLPPGTTRPATHDTSVSSRPPRTVYI